MNNTKNKVPELRFPRFDGEWEQCKFADCFKMSAGYAFKYQDYCNDGVALINGESIQHGNIDDSNLNHLPDTFIERYPEFVLNENDIVVGLNRPITQGQLKIARIPHKYRGSLLYQRAGKIQYKQSIDTNFAYVLLSKEILKFTLKEAIGSDQPFIRTSKLDKWNMFLPSNMNEQECIGDFFRNLDNIITLHQRKCDNTKELKQAMLQKMFPKEGEKAPEIRFPGFTEDWEQRKLGDVTESIKNGYTYKADGSRDHRYKITRIESISSGVINTEKLGSSDEVNESYRLVDGDILFSHINSLSYIANTALYTADLGEIYHGMNLLNIRSKHEKIDSHFLLHLLKKESTRDWFRIIAKPAVNQASISTTEVGAFEFLMPRMEEQKKISLVLDNLDNLITLHQRKCDSLKELKKALLQKMFI